MDLDQLQKQFLEYLEVEKNRALKTIENYDRYLKRFLKLSGMVYVMPLPPIFCGAESRARLWVM